MGRSEIHVSAFCQIKAKYNLGGYDSKLKCLLIGYCVLLGGWLAILGFGVCSVCFLCQFLMFNHSFFPTAVLLRQVMACISASTSTLSELASLNDLQPGLFSHWAWAASRHCSAESCFQSACSRYSPSSLDDGTCQSSWEDVGSRASPPQQLLCAPARFRWTFWSAFPSLETVIVKNKNKINF